LLIKYSTSFGGPKPRWEDDIKMDLQEVGWGSMDLIHLALASIYIYKKVNLSCTSRNGAGGAEA
jgi:hypothetical protein